MRIKQLILNGFKSFPDKTVITFDPTINAIIGPNGCGKTNILDGLRWVMGESSFAQMRCTKTEDLIFAGNKYRPAVNYAEVTLILENHNNYALSAEETNNQNLISHLASEIEIKRRFFRSGDSEFYINRKLCKLKDIQDLFTSGGGSGHAYSIFDLPTMRQIISSNLKNLFIEAAGLAFYQERKEEIERKLKLTIDDLTRLNDIINERQRIVRNLKRQAYRLMAFEKVKAEQKKLEVLLLRFEYQKLIEKEQNLENEYSLLQNRLAAIEQEISNLELEKSQIKKELQEKENVRNNLQSEIALLKEQIIIYEERLKANLDKQSYIIKEQDKIQAQFNFILPDQTNLDMVDTKQEYLEKIITLQKEKEEEFENLRKSNKDLENEIFSLQLKLEELQNKDKDIFISLAQINSEINKLQMKLSDNQRYLRTLKDSLQALRDSQNKKNINQEYQTALVKFLDKNFIGFLSDLISTSPQYQFALSSVLLSLFNAIIVNEMDKIGSVDELQSLLSDNFLSIIDSQQYGNIPNLPVINNSDCQSLLNFVNFKSNTPSFLSSFFASYLVVDNYQQIISLRQQFPQYAFVTKTGIILNHDGILIIPPRTNSASNLNNQIYSLEQEISLLESKNIELLKEIEINHRNKESKEIEKNTLNEELKKIQTLIIEKRKTNKENLEKASNFLYELNKRREEIIQIQAAMNEIKLTQNQQQTLTEEKNRLLQELTELKNEASVLQNNIHNLKAKLTNQQHILQEFTPTLLTARYDDIDKKIILLRSELDNIRQKLNTLQYQKLEIITQRQFIEKQAQDYLDNGIELLKSNVITKPIDEIKKELSLVSRKITAIGMINPLAKDDYEREKNELNRLTSQYQDIVKAQTNLNLALSELTKKAEQMFLETYDKVKISFRQIFKDIFTEGEADLILETPTNPLDSDIRIIAQPKGKSPRRLDQLSDGEKALLALSLLFAFYDIKPAPFVFMDEVDAPLDDANVKRFTNFLRRISQTTQVIIITHNKLTIESAAVVIGVTTEEPGISKIVSVRFKDTIASVKA